jgi:hypothetical protein
MSTSHNSEDYKSTKPSTFSNNLWLPLATCTKMGFAIATLNRATSSSLKIAISSCSISMQQRSSNHLTCSDRQVNLFGLLLRWLQEVNTQLTSTSGLLVWPSTTCLLESSFLSEKKTCSRLITLWKHWILMTLRKTFKHLSRACWLSINTWDRKLLK